jgi:hypothetical protein
MTNEHSDLGAAGMGLVLAAYERFDGQQIGPVFREGFSVITPAIEVLRVGVHVARHPVLLVEPETVPSALLIRKLVANCALN